VRVEKTMQVKPSILNTFEHSFRQSINRITIVDSICVQQNLEDKR
jgi:hypothetical protein